MPAVSKKQQRFFGMVRAAQKGEGAASPEVAKVASEIKKKDAKDFASTKHKGLPMKKEETVFEGDVHSGQGEKIQKRTKAWMDKKGQKGAPGLDAMKARTVEHKAKRGEKRHPRDQKELDRAKSFIKKNPNFGLKSEGTDKAFEYVKKQIAAKYGKDSYVSKDNPRKPTTAAQKKAAADHRAKLAKQDHRDETEKATSGRYNDRSRSD